MSLKEGHDPTNDFVRKIRLEMRQQFPDVTVWFPPADIVAQILNFGLPAPIDVQIKLFPGIYTTVHFELKSDSQSMLVPENVLLFGEEGPAVGIAGADGKVSIRKIKIARDLGNTLQVQGLAKAIRSSSTPPTVWPMATWFASSHPKIHVRTQRNNSAAATGRAAGHGAATVFLSL